MGLDAAMIVDGTPFTNAVITATSNNSAEWLGRRDIWMIALSDQSTALTTGLKETLRVPAACRLIDVRMDLATTSSSGLPTVDIKQAGTTVMGTKVSIDVSETTSVTAASTPAISNPWLNDNAVLTFHQDVAGTGAAGERIKLYVQYGPSPSPSPTP